MKRSANFVPLAFRDALDTLSKADLMEVAFSLAGLAIGEENEAKQYEAVISEHQAISRAMSRKPAGAPVSALTVARARLEKAEEGVRHAIRCNYRQELQDQAAANVLEFRALVANLEACR